MSGFNTYETNRLPSRVFDNIQITDGKPLRVCVFYWIPAYAGTTDIGFFAVSKLTNCQLPTNCRTCGFAPELCKIIKAGLMYKDVRADNCSLRYLHFRRPWRSYADFASLHGCNLVGVAH